MQDQQTAITSLADLEQLKQQAEAQQRRRAPPLSGQQPQKKKPKVDGGEEQGEDDEEEQEGAVGRFAYAAAGAIAAGSTCLMASCGFNRQRSAAKELLSIVKPLLPEGTQLQMVKVGCRGLAVVRLEPPVPVIPLVGQVLDRIQSGQLKHTRFCERIVPAEMTCLLTSVALEAALTKAARAYLAGRQGQQQQQGAADGAAESAADAVPAQQQPVEFAVMYKSRGVDEQILADMEKMALQQQQQEQEQKQQQEQDKQQQEQDKQLKQQQAAGDGAGPAAEELQGLNRQRIIDLAVAVMQECCKECGGAKVNLRKPQVAVMVEVVPLLRQQTACAVAMLPASIMSDAAKLKIKPTSLESEQHGQKQKQQGSGGGSKKK